MEEVVLTWTVVQFVEDGTVEAVPSTWIQGDMCHWPPYFHQKLVMAIRKCEGLNTCWPTHKIKSFRNSTFDDYMKARNKAKIAEDTSDLNNTADENNEEKPKRKRIAKILSDSSDTDEVEYPVLAIPPKINKVNKKFESKEKDLSLDMEQPRKHQHHISTATQRNNGNTFSDRRNVKFNEETASNSHRSCDAEPKEKDLNLDIEQPRKQHRISTATQQNNGIKSSDRRNLKFNEETASTRSCDTDKMFKTILEQNHILRGMVAESLEKIDRIEVLLRNANLNEAESSKTTNSLFKCAAVDFPIDTDEQFDMFENYLNNDKEFDCAVAELSKLGGSSVYDLIKRSLVLLISNDQTLKYSWLGRKGKRPFNKSKIAQVLIRSVEKSGLSKCDKDTEIAIQAWLKRASDRRTQMLKKF